MGTSHKEPIKPGTPNFSASRSPQRATLSATSVTVVTVTAIAPATRAWLSRAFSGTGIAFWYPNALTIWMMATSAMNTPSVPNATGAYSRASNGAASTTAVCPTNVPIAKTPTLRPKLPGLRRRPSDRSGDSIGSVIPGLASCRKSAGIATL